MAEKSNLSIDDESVYDDPNFAVICSFITRYGTLLGLPDLTFTELEKWIVDTRYLDNSLRDVMLRLLKRWKGAANEDKFTQYLLRFTHTHSQVDAWELEEFGFQRCKISTKLRIIKNLMEQQFDSHAKFKEKINEIPASDLRWLPIGRDISGRAYWYLIDNNLTIRVYREEQDDVENESWQIVVSDRDQLAELISTLQEQKVPLGVEKSRSTSPSTLYSEENTQSSDALAPKQEGLPEDKTILAESKATVASTNHKAESGSDVTNGCLSQQNDELKEVKNERAVDVVTSDSGQQSKIEKRDVTVKQESFDVEERKSLKKESKCRKLSGEEVSKKPRISSLSCLATAVVEAGKVRVEEEAGKVRLGEAGTVRVCLEDSDSADHRPTICSDKTTIASTQNGCAEDSNSAHIDENSCPALKDKSNTLSTDTSVTVEILESGGVVLNLLEPEVTESQCTVASSKALSIPAVNSSELCDSGRLKECSDTSKADDERNSEGMKTLNDKSHDDSAFLKSDLPATGKKASEVLNNEASNDASGVETSQIPEASATTNEKQLPVECGSTESSDKQIKESCLSKSSSIPTCSLETGENGEESKDHGMDKLLEVDKEPVILPQSGFDASKTSDNEKENVSRKEEEIIVSSPQSETSKSRSPKHIIKPCRRVKLSAETSPDSKASSGLQNVVTPRRTPVNSAWQAVRTSPKSKTVQDVCTPKSKACAEGADVRTSVKRKRDEVRHSSSSSEAESGQSESELSETASEGAAVDEENEPPSKRKRDKALLTAAQRDRRSGRNKLSSPSSCSGDQTKVDAQDETTVVKENPEADGDISSGKDEVLQANSSEAVVEAEKQSTAELLDQCEVKQSSNVSEHDAEVKQSSSVSEQETQVKQSSNVPEQETHMKQSSNVSEQDAEVKQSSNVLEQETQEKQSSNVLEQEMQEKQSNNLSEQETQGKQSNNLSEQETQGNQNAKETTEVEERLKFSSNASVTQDEVEAGATEKDGVVGETNQENTSKAVGSENDSAKNTTEQQNGVTSDYKAHSDSNSLSRQTSEETSTKKEENSSDSSKDQDEKTISGGVDDTSSTSKLERNQKKRLHFGGQKNVTVTDCEPDYEPTSKIGRAFEDKMADGGGDEDVEKVVEDEVSSKQQPTRGGFRRRGSSRGKRRGRPSRCENRAQRDASAEDKGSVGTFEKDDKKQEPETCGIAKSADVNSSKSSDRKPDADDELKACDKEQDGRNEEESEKKSEMGNNVEGKGSQAGKETGVKRRGRKKQIDVLLDDSALLDLSICEASCESTSFEPRRSSRANKGQRKFVTVVEEPKRKRKTNSELEEEPRKTKREEESKETLEVAKEDELKKSKKKRRGRELQDEDFVPGSEARKAKSSRRSRKGRRGKKVTDSEQDEEEEEEEDEYFEEEDESLKFASASSSDNDVESDGSLYEPSGRNARRAAAIKEKVAAVVVNDQPCCRCGKTELPEWILLCDRCDAGYHTACLRPPLMVIPEGDWYCPPCEHIALIEKLQEQLMEYDKSAKQNTRLTQRKQRLAFVGISLSNILPENPEKTLRSLPDDIFDRELDENKEEEEDSRSESGGSTERDEGKGMESGEGENSDSGGRVRRRRRENERVRKRERKYESSCTSDGPSRAKGRQRRSHSSDEESGEEFEAFRRSHRRRRDISYKFEEYEQLITTAIRDDMKEDEGSENEEAAVEEDDSSKKDETETAPAKGPPTRRVSKGKDMSTILGVSDSEEEEEKPATKSRKRGRKLTRLDSDEDNEDEDESEEYKISGEEASSATADEDYQVDDDDDTDDWCVQGSPVWGRGRRKKSSARAKKTRRTRRTHSRYDSSGTEEEEEESDEDFRPPQRSVTRRRINYQENSDDDDDDDVKVKPAKDDKDSSPDVRKSAPWSKSNSRSSKLKRNRGRGKSDSDYEPDADDEPSKRSGKGNTKASRWQSSSEEKSDKDSDVIEDDDDDSATKKKNTKEVAQNGLKKDRLKNFVFDSSDSSETSQKSLGKKKNAGGKEGPVNRSKVEQRVSKKRVNVVAESDTDEDSICAHNPAVTSITGTVATSESTPADSKAPSPGDGDGRSPTSCDRDRRLSNSVAAKTRRTGDTNDTSLGKDSNVNVENTQNSDGNISIAHEVDHKLNGSSDTHTVAASFTIDNILTKSPVSRPVKRRHFDTQSGEESEGSLGAREDKLKDVEDLVDFINQT